LGVGVDFVPSEYLTSKLAEELPRGHGRRVLILRADIGNPEVVSELERDGFRVTDLAVYRSASASGTSGAPESDIDGADAVVFASPSAVEAFMKRVGESESASKMTKTLLALCIGPVTAQAARARGFERIVTPETYTIDGLLGCLEEAASEGK
jgi:uroporphyrinogen-III synthase